jgi:hypothetical protein
MERPASSASVVVIHDKEPHTKGAGMPRIHHPDTVWHGWDVHKDTISVAVLHPEVEKIPYWSEPINSPISHPPQVPKLLRQGRRAPLLPGSLQL